MNDAIRVGIICPSEIALRRFLPSLKDVEGIEFAGVAIADKDEWIGEVNKEIIDIEESKAKDFVQHYGGKIYNSYRELIVSKDIDAVYLPLPPALHYRWAKEALMNDKHVFIEKPSTIQLKDTEELVSLAKERNLVLHENYMFQYHSQIQEIKDLISSNRIGKIYSYHSRFGFPMRQKSDFRYNKDLGGGALLDAGGYISKLAVLLLGSTAKIVNSQLKYDSDFDVDMYGMVTFINNKNQVFIGEFGMSCEYQCNLSIWGSEGIITTERIYTAPDDFVPVVNIQQSSKNKKIELLSDCSFKKSIQYFILAINDNYIKNKLYDEILLQAYYIDKIREENDYE